MPREQWERVQEIFAGRLGNRRRRVKHDFAFSGLIRCGHCGCALVAEYKKGQYTYYHCTGHKSKCPEPYVREEVLTAEFQKILAGLQFDEEILQWVKRALQESHADMKRFHDEAIARLEADYNRLQTRLDALYVDKLDGVVHKDFFERKNTEWRNEQRLSMEALEKHQLANQNYFADGIQLLELAARAASLFECQPPAEKRRLLGIVLSNSSWKGGTLTAELRQPFDLLADRIEAAKTADASGGGSAGGFENWLPGMDSNHDSRLQRPLSYH